MKRASLKQNISALYAMQIANYLIPMITLPYLVRTLGAQQYGLISFAYACTYLMVLFVDAGFNITGAKDLAALNGTAQQNTNAARHILWCNQVLKAVLVLLCALLLLLLLILVPQLRQEWPVYALSFFTVIGSLVFPIWVFQGLEQMHFTTLLFLAGRLISTAGILLWVRAPADYELAAFLQSTSTLFSGILAYPILVRTLGLRWLWPGKQAVLSTFKQGRHYFFSDFIANAFGNSAVFVLGLFQSKEIVGVFAAIEKLARAMASGFLPVQKALFPRITLAYQKSEMTGFLLTQKTLHILSLLAVLAAALLLPLAPWVLELVFGSAFVPYANVLRVMGVWFACSVISMTLGDYLLLARGKGTRLASLQNRGSLVLLIGLPAIAGMASSSVLFGAASVILLAQLVILFFLYRDWRAHQKSLRVQPTCAQGAA